MKLKVNGKEKTYKQGKLSVVELLKIDNVERPQMVSVQHNGVFVKREEYATTYLKEADEIDFLYFMGGGTFQSHCQNRRKICAM